AGEPPSDLTGNGFQGLVQVRHVVRVRKGAADAADHLQVVWISARGPHRRAEAPQVVVRRRAERMKTPAVPHQSSKQRLVQRLAAEPHPGALLPKRLGLQVDVVELEEPAAEGRWCVRP